MSYALIKVKLVDDDKNGGGGVDDEVESKTKARVLMMLDNPKVKDTITIFYKGFAYISRNKPNLVTEAMRLAVVNFNKPPPMDGEKADVVKADEEKMVGEIDENAKVIVELFRIKKMGECKGNRFGGPAAFYRLTFNVRYKSTIFNIRRKTRTHGIYARITEVEHEAGDFFTALTMPVPGSLFCPIDAPPIKSRRM